MEREFNYTYQDKKGKTCYMSVNERQLYQILEDLKIEELEQYLKHRKSQQLEELLKDRTTEEIEEYIKTRKPTNVR